MAKNKAAKLLLKIFKKGYYTEGKERSLTALKGAEYRENSLFLPSKIASLGRQPTFSRKEEYATEFLVSVLSPLELGKEKGSVIIYFESTPSLSKKGDIEDELTHRTSYLLTRDNKTAKEYVLYNDEHSDFEESAILLSPQVEVLCDENDKYVSPYLVKVLTLPLPNKDKFLFKGKKAYADTIEKRINNLLRLADYLSYETLILPIIDKESIPLNDKEMASIYHRAFETISSNKNEIITSFKKVVYYGTDETKEYHNSFK